jgi:nickel transport protein
MTGGAVLLGCWLALLLTAPAVAAHGALVEYRQVPGVVIEARYDTGQPMVGARITVYAPDNPTQPWLVGTSDEAGRFSFLPAPELSGTWAVQARQAGHGALVHFQLSEAVEPGTETTLVIPATSVDPGGPAQRWIMALAVIWGFIGTALFFARRRTQRSPGQTAS